LVQQLQIEHTGDNVVTLLDLASKGARSSPQGGDGLTGACP